VLHILAAFVVLRMAESVFLMDKMKDTKTNNEFFDSMKR
jgi:transcription termination factor Rho